MYVLSLSSIRIFFPKIYLIFRDMRRHASVTLHSNINQILQIKRPVYCTIALLYYASSREGINPCDRNEFLY
jgi:hypothetical protein